MKLQVAGFLNNSLVNGTGLRSVVFVSGCRHRCNGCHNKDMQDYNYGDSIEVDEVFERIKRNIPLIKGVTFSGGEPFDSARGLTELAVKLKKEDLNIWSYSGYTYEELINSKDTYKLKLLECIDVLVDGKFDENLKEGAPKYAGSSNQRIIDVKKSREACKVVELK
jgi:anaerobic ribonucleoside-triphosphate reductase activating protein